MIKTLAIIRHAKSSWEYDSISDLDRPLTEPGICNTILVANKLKMLKVFPEKMIASPANRALHTALIVARELIFPVGDIRIDQTLYHESEDDILKLIRSTSDTIQTLFIFGHNPTFTTLSNRYLKHSIDNLPTSGVTLLDFEVDSWADIKKRTVQTERLLFPKKL